ncbi:MAG: hypothetical protein ACLFTV_01935, partial [Desulfococcaceae bacterium]
TAVANFEGKANAIHGGKTRIQIAGRRSPAIKRSTTSWPKNLQGLGHLANLTVMSSDHFQGMAPPRRKF